MNWRMVVCAALVLGCVRAPRPSAQGGGVGVSFELSETELTVGEHRVAFGVRALGRGRPEPVNVTPPSRGDGEVRRSLGPGIVEWWRSLSGGVEHGVTIASRPMGEGALVVEVAVEGDLSPHGSGTAVELRDAGGAVVASYAGLMVLDATGAAVPAHMAARGRVIAIVVDDANARYPLVIDPLLTAQEARLPSVGAADADLLGHAVAISGDGTRAVVGQPYDDNARGTDAGSARIFVRSGAVWTEEALLLAPDGAAGDLFARAVAISGDGSRVVLGAHLDNVPRGTDAGSASVFSRTGTTWTFEAQLLASDGAARDFLGTSTAISAAGLRVVLGASEDDTAGGSNAGSARVFMRTGTTWAEEATLVAADAMGGELLGTSVSLSADAMRLVVGAHRDSTAFGAETGTARVFLRSGSVWTEEATLAPSSGFRSYYGYAVAISGDGTRALLGAGPPGVDAVDVVVYARGAGGWVEEQRLLPPDSMARDALGYSLALSFDGSRAIAGSPSHDTAAGLNAGSARVFVRAGTTWTAEATLVAPDAEADEAFGRAVSITADGSRALVGVPFDRDATASTGSARVFTLAATLGSPCGTDGACGSGFCARGACCTSRCAGDCEACTTAATGLANGTCGTLTTAPAAATICRPGTDLCDAPEACAAGAAACPADALSVAGSSCRGASGACDLADTCDGTSAACIDRRAPVATVCRASAGGCDGAELCDGTAAICPTDAAATSGTLCRSPLGACDAEERCDGTSFTCPGDARLAAGVACGGSGAGSCSTSGICDGTSVSCPGATPRPADTVCHPAAAGSPCDVDDVCDGTRDVCTPRYAGVDVVCLASGSGPCDTDDHCAGTSANCVDTYLADVECRASAGACDAPERCLGDGADCPPDLREAAGQLCRASTASCDPVEACDGVAASCPSDITSCDGDGGSGALDAAPSSDGGAADAEPGPVAATGCACGAASPAPGRGLPLLLLFFGAFVVVRCRR